MAEKESDFKLETQQDGQKDQRQDAGEWIPAFLAILRNTGNIYLSCREAKVSRKTVYLWRDTNQQFAEDMKDAMEDALDLLEWNGWRRAKAMSDNLLKFFLQAHRYGFKQEHEHSGPGGGPILVRDVISIIDDGEDEEH
jgi:hypothetical protein